MQPRTVSSLTTLTGADCWLSGAGIVRDMKRAPERGGLPASGKDASVLAGASCGQLPVPPNCTMAGVSLIVAALPEAVIEALPIHTPAVANRPHSTRPAMPRPT